MNYVFSDGEGTADNNSGSDYATPVSGKMTAERWVEEAPLRVVSCSRHHAPVKQHNGACGRSLVRAGRSCSRAAGLPVPE